jgi:hypothetical protein
MTDTANIANIANTVTSTITALATKAGAAISAYGPQTVDFAAHYLHVIALITAATDILGLVSVPILGYIAYRFCKYFIIKVIDGGDGPEWLIPIVVGMFTAFYIIIASFTCLESLLSTQELLGLFAPKIAVVQYALNAVTPNTGNSN